MSRPNTHPDAIDRKIVAFYINTTNERGYPPSFSEIGQHVGFSSKASVQARLKTIVELGLLPGYRTSKAAAS